MSLAGRTVQETPGRLSSSCSSRWHLPSLPHCSALSETAAGVRSSTRQASTARLVCWSRSSSAPVRLSW